ncbi:uncharacterized protein [Montipora foliosa]|uniref:uncharacterized protein n=1 Tax=Montipora foliosa TaxID=591990 RepID=UPI0035F2171D
MNFVLVDLLLATMLPQFLFGRKRGCFFDSSIFANMRGKNLTQRAETPRHLLTGNHLRFITLLMICCCTLANAMVSNESPERPQPREDIGNTESYDDVGEASENLMPSQQRERRSASNYRVLQERLQALEERHNKSKTLMEKKFQEMETRFIKRLDALLNSPPRSSDSSLLSYLLVRDGRYNGVGRIGPPGPPGKAGPQGSTGPPGKSGVTYVRWGRTTCPSGADFVYKGIIGGEDHNHPGGGGNYLCLPNKPKYDKYKDGWQNSGYVYGTEYEVNQYNGDPFKTSLHNNDAVCAVCFAKSRSSKLMIRARNVCPSGWTEEYHGYLMTEYYNHKGPKNFICVDGDPESVVGSSANKNGALLYPVEGACGSLPCSPYVAGRELTCAVCTK